MKWTIPSSNVKTFARAVQSMSKLTETVYLEANDKGLLLHALNSSRSAYASFMFLPQFFAEINIQAKEQPIRCKVSIKGLLLVFKSSSILEKNVERCCIDVTRDSDTIIFLFICRHDVVKIYTIRLLTFENLNEGFKKGSYPITFVSQAKTLIDGVQNFGQHVDEVSLAVGEENVVLKTYLENEPEPLQMMCTSVQFEIEEFEQFNLNGGETEVVFSLKELKTLLHFVEPCSNVNISVQIDHPGKPMVFSIKTAGYEATFVLASMSNSNTDSNQSLQPVVAQKERPVPRDGSQNGENSSQSILHQRAGPSGIRSRAILDDDSWFNQAEGTEKMQQDEDEDDTVPATPPHKRFRKFFLGICDAPMEATVRVEEGEILAPATDEEDNI